MRINTSGPDGNAFSIMGVVKRFLRETGQEDKWDATREEMTAGDYVHLCEVATEVTCGAITFYDGNKE